MLSADHSSGPVVLFQIFIHNQPSLVKILGHGRSGIRRWMLDVWPINIAAGEGEVCFDRFTRVPWVADNQTPYDIDLIAVQQVDSPDGSIAGITSVCTCRVLG